MALPCNPCHEQCVSAAHNTELSFRATVIAILCSIANKVAPASSLRFNLTSANPATNEVVIAAPGAGKKLRVRSLYAQVQDANTDVQFFSRTGGGVNTAVGPNFDYLNNAGVVLPLNEDGWFECADNCSLVVTTTGGAVDLLGTYEIVSA